MDLVPDDAVRGVPVPQRTTADPVWVKVMVEYENGATREYTSRWPLSFSLAVAPLDAQPRSEPKLMITFAGNALEGGIQVHSEGTPP